MGLAVCVLPLLAGCAVGTAPSGMAVREPPLPYPPGVRERIVRIALAEWEEWGSVVAEPGAPRPEGGAEASLAAFPRVLAYWRAAPDEGGAVARNRARYAALLGAGPGTVRPGAVWSEPAWSAAFVSWVMRSAGVDGREFTGSAAHAFYLDGLLADARDFPDRAPFVPHGWDGRAPGPGDLVCADRSRAPLADLRERYAEAGRFRPMHCDVVVRAAPGMVEAVGGNVADAVTLTRYAADPETGRLLPRPPGEPVGVGVVENRLGRLPPFAVAGAGS